MDIYTPLEVYIKFMCDENIVHGITVHIFCALYMIVYINLILKLYFFNRLINWTYIYKQS